MIEFAQLAAPYVGYAVMLAGGAIIAAAVAIAAADMGFRAIKSIFGLAYTAAALRAWAKDNPRKVRFWTGGGE